MGMFDKLAGFAVTVPGVGTFGLPAAGGGATAPEPTPLTPARPAPGTTGFLGWINANKTTAAVGGVVVAVLLFLLLRRR